MFDLYSFTKSKYTHDDKFNVLDLSVFENHLGSLTDSLPASSSTSSSSTAVVDGGLVTDEQETINSERDSADASAEGQIVDNVDDNDVDGRSGGAHSLVITANGKRRAAKRPKTKQTASSASDMDGGGVVVDV